MAPIVKFEMKRDGPRKLRQLPAVQRDLERRARAIAAAAGPGMFASSIRGQNRARASVITATHQARDAEARSRALTRAIGRGRT